MTWTLLSSSKWNKPWALMAKPEERQVLLGSKKSKPEKAAAEAVEGEPGKA